MDITITNIFSLINNLISNHWKFYIIIESENYHVLIWDLGKYIDILYLPSYFNLLSIDTSPNV